MNGRRIARWRRASVLAVSLAGFALLGCLQQKMTIRASAQTKKSDKPTSPDKLTVLNGDGLRFILTPGGHGFIYAFLKGTSGTFTTVFPRLGQNVAPNEVKPGQAVRIPYEENGWMTVDDSRGTEWLYIIFTKHKVDRLEDLMDKESPSSDEIATAIDKMKATMPGDYSLTKVIKDDYSEFSVTTKDADGFVLAEIGLQHR